MKIFIRFALFISVLHIATCAVAQMPNDVIYMPKKSLCIAGIYSNNSWKNYWEGTLKRENLNIGTHTTQSASIMVAGGITDKLNAIVMLPYITTNASAGNLLGQKGIQDLSAWLKYQLIYKDGFSLHGVVGASIPVGNYVPSFLPMSIGFQTKSLSGRIIANYQHSTGLYLLGNANYTVRSNIKIDQDSYQANNKVYNTNVVAMPNTTETSIAVGILKPAFQTEINLNRFMCVSGDNIRRNDMPFPTNDMRMTSIGWYGKYQPKNVGFNARINYVIDGLNVGQSTTFSIGFLYQIGQKGQFCVRPKTEEERKKHQGM